MTPVEERIDHDPEIVRRFWAKVDKRIEGDCWQWLGLTTHGYGVYNAGGRSHRAHRFAYEVLVGPIPEGLTIDHLCRNRSCVNPAHLEPVTNRVNVLRGAGRSAENFHKTHCVNGHPFSGDNVTYSVTAYGRKRRRCRACHAEWARRHRQQRPLICACGETFPADALDEHLENCVAQGGAA